MIDEFGGLATPMPWFSTLFVIASLSSIGLPFLNGFVGEFLILIGSWTSSAIQNAWIATMLAATGVIWAAVYMLWMLQRVVFGKDNQSGKRETAGSQRARNWLAGSVAGVDVIHGCLPASRFWIDRKRSVEEMRARVAAPPTGGSFASLRTFDHERQSAPRNAHEPDTKFASVSFV